MSYLIGLLVVLAAIFLQLDITGELGSFVDLPSIVIPLLLIYGLSTITFGASTTLKSIAGIRYLCTEKPDEKPFDSDIYKRQIHFSIIAAAIMLLSSSIAIATLLDDISMLGPSVAIPLLGSFYPLLFAGLIYYPLYIKLSK